MKREIGLVGALGISFHQIVGGGVIALTGTAIAMTGGGTPIAFATATVLVMVVAAPISALGAAMPTTGGAYVYPARLLHPLAGYLNMWLWTLGNLSLSIYGIAAGQYLHSLDPWFDAQLVAIIMIVGFYAANLLGAAVSARIGVVLGVVMMLAFGMFIVFGLLGVEHWEVFAHPIPNGTLELFKAAALLSFATRGGQVVAELGDELKNPGRNIPIACLGGTALAGVLYILLALPSAGVLPIEEVANQPMSVVAQHITGQAGFVFFVLGGSVVALVGSLNSNLLWGTKALLAAVQDGWFPRRLGAVNRRFGTPHWLLTLMFVIGIAPVLTGLDMADIANAASALQQVNAVLIVAAAVRLRTVRRDLYTAAPFKLGARTMRVLLAATVLISAWQFTLLTADLTPSVITAGAAWIALGAAWAAYRYPKLPTRDDGAVGTAPAGKD
ncbi:hypothetical protein GCM10022205_15490 [Spinactinospora alkalitolerans]